MTHGGNPRQAPDGPMPTQPKPRPLPASPFHSPARSIADVAAPSLARLFGKRGLANMEILAHWPEIVGAELGAVCAPEKIVWPRAAAQADAEPDVQAGAVLHIRVEGPQAVELQHRTDEIIARINQLFGFRAIEKIRIVQAPLASPQRHAAPPAAEKPNPGTGPNHQDKPLDAALARLERGIKKR
jgi:hypothetical protein